MDFPLINGHRYSWASASFKGDGSEIVHIKELSYTHKLEPGMVRGTGSQVAGRTRGEYSAEGSMTLLREGWDALRDQFGDGYLEKSFALVVSYADDGQPIVTDELVGVRITSVENSPSQGTDGLEVSLELSILYVLENGKKPLRNMRL